MFLHSMSAASTTPRVVYTFCLLENSWIAKDVELSFGAARIVAVIAANPRTLGLLTTAETRTSLDGMTHTGMTDIYVCPLNEYRNKIFFVKVPPHIECVDETISLRRLQTRVHVHVHVR